MKYPSLRPREKLSLYGPSSLQMYELWSIIFGSGTKGYGVETIAKQVEKCWDSEHMESLRSIAGIGNVNFARIEAVCELGRRLYAPASFAMQYIRTSEDALVHLKEYALLKQECLICLYLNARHELLKKKLVTKGVLTMNLVHPREVFSEALRLGASAVIISHNHPSGSLEASEADMEVTARLYEAGEILGITLLDHILVSKEGWKSLL